jgi:phage shock protein A
MALLDRVATLIRANLNDLIDQAEDPEKMLKQVILDMQNQLLQLKTQVAIAVADQHLLTKKKIENSDKSAEWRRKAELAVDKGQEELARSAIERSLNFDRIAAGYDQQVADQSLQVENLKTSLHKLEDKHEEARNKIDLLIAQHRRARAFKKAGEARMNVQAGDGGDAFSRMNQKVQREEAIGLATDELLKDSVDDQFARLQKNDEIEKVLAELKARRNL